MQENQSGGTKFQYHPELISLYNSGVVTGAIVGNIITPLLFVTILHTFIPQEILVLWFTSSVIVAIFRIVIVKRYTENSHYDRFLKLTSLSIALSGTIWGTVTILTYLYAPPEYLSFVILLILGLISATITTLTPLYKTYLYYVLFSILPLIIIFFMKSGMLNIGTALLIVLFTIFILVGGYKNYKKLYEVIILKDKLKVLNGNLEGEVKKRTLELEALNHTLEDKVKDEISKNRDKDQQLVQQSRMAQMGEMISMIAHQWRQPLGAIAAASIDLKMKMAFASFDLDNKEGQEACSSYFDEQLSNIERYVQSLTTTIDDFRNFYKPNKEKKVITINEPIKKSLSIIEAAAKANGVHIITDYGSQKVLALFDSELMQVFLNIIKNAQDNFLEKNTPDATIMIGTKDIEKGVQVEICDNGGGIPEDIREKIFDPYFSTKDEKNGTGLGLYMSKTIIEEHHDGKLFVKNNDNGVTFSIILIG